MGAQSDTGESSCEGVKPEREELNKNNRAPYKCDYEGCSAFFKRPSRLKQHQCIHTGERPFKCERPNCNRAYTHACHLKRHIAVNHQTELFKKIIKCSYPGCNLSVSSETNLRRHFRRKHEQSFICNECGKSFTKNQHLRAHITSHTGDLPYRCPDCNACFATGGTLRRHQRCHKIHACDINDCKEIFQKWTELRHHLKVAHPLEYICATCEKKFKSKGNIAEHVKTHLSDRPSFTCSYPGCNRSYVRESYLSYHIKWYHEGEGIKCTYEGCGRVICTKARWVKHMAWHEKSHTIRRRPVTGKSRKPRFDKGVPRRSMAASLAGIPPLPLSLEKKIITGDSLDSEEDQAIQDLGELNVFSLGEPGTSSAKTEENIISTQVCNTEVPLCT